MPYIFRCCKILIGQWQFKLNCSHHKISSGATNSPLTRFLTFLLYNIMKAAFSIVTWREILSHGFNIVASYLIYKHPVTVLGGQICFHSLQTQRERERERNGKSLDQLLRFHVNFLGLRSSYLASELLYHTKDTLLCSTPICSASAVFQWWVALPNVNQ